VYAIITHNDTLVLVKKSRGPYKGKLDLPGGRIEHAETPLEALKREVAEETGIILTEATLCDVYSMSVKYEAEDQTPILLHHIGIIYLLTEYDISVMKSHVNQDDVIEVQWYKLEELIRENLTPFAANVYEILRG
jgi:8-oxo-dGTP diphosphatase